MRVFLLYIESIQSENYVEKINTITLLTLTSPQQKISLYSAKDIKLKFSKYEKTINPKDYALEVKSMKPKLRKICQIVLQFWEFCHVSDEESKKKNLQFNE